MAPGLAPRTAGHAAALLCAAWLLCGPASAASQSDEDACRPDVFEICASAIPNEAAIVACLNANLAGLSPACRSVMAPTQAVPPHTGPRLRRTARP